MSKKIILSAVSAILVIVFLSGTCCYGLAPAPASQNPAVKRGILCALKRTQVRFAESADAVKLLAANYDASALLLSSGKYLVSKEVADDNLKLLLAIRHEDVEAILQIIAKEDASRYRGMKELILRYFPPSQHNRLPAELYVNHVVARAFQWLVLLREGVIYKSDIPQSELPFLQKIIPIIDANRHNYFTAEFWNAHIRAKKIRTALNNGMRFYVVAMPQPENFLDEAKSLHHEAIEMAQCPHLQNKAIRLFRKANGLLLRSQGTSYRGIEDYHKQLKYLVDLSRIIINQTASTVETPRFLKELVKFVYLMRTYRSVDILCEIALEAKKVPSLAAASDNIFELARQVAHRAESDNIGGDDELYLLRCIDEKSAGSAKVSPEAAVRWLLGDTDEYGSKINVLLDKLSVAIETPGRENLIEEAANSVLYVSGNIRDYELARQLYYISLKIMRYPDLRYEARAFFKQSIVAMLKEGKAAPEKDLSECAVAVFDGKYAIGFSDELFIEIIALISSAADKRSAVGILCALNNKLFSDRVVNNIVSAGKNPKRSSESVICAAKRVAESAGSQRSSLLKLIESAMPLSYDTKPAVVLIKDLMYGQLQEGRIYEIKYDTSRLTHSQIEIIKTYTAFLKARSSDPGNIKLRPFSGAKGSDESLIAVYCAGENFKGEGHVDVSMPEGSIQDYLLRMTGMLNIAFAAANIPDNLSEEDVERYRPMLSYINKQYEAILGAALAIPDSPEDILKAIRRIVLCLPKAMRMDTSRIEEYNRLAKEALIMA